MAQKRKGDGDGLIGGIIGVIGTTLVEEYLLIPPRLTQARKEGYDQGYNTRDRELQPVIKRCEQEREALRLKHAEQQRKIDSMNLELARLNRENERLKSENEKLRPKPIPRLN